MNEATPRRRSFIPFRGRASGRDTQRMVEWHWSRSDGAGNRAPEDVCVVIGHAVWGPAPLEDEVVKPFSKLTHFRGDTFLPKLLPVYIRAPLSSRFFSARRKTNKHYF